jgi:hypothetical protein
MILFDLLKLCRRDVNPHTQLTNYLGLRAKNLEFQELFGCNVRPTTAHINLAVIKTECVQGQQYFPQGGNQGVNTTLFFEPKYLNQEKCVTFSQKFGYCRSSVEYCLSRNEPSAIPQHSLIS